MRQYKLHRSTRELIFGCRFHALWKHMTGNKLHTSNYDYAIQNAVYNNFQTGELIGNKLLKVDNPQQAELLDMVCAIANRRKSGVLAGPAQIEEVKSRIAEHAQSMTTEFLDRIEQICTASGLFVLACAVLEKNEELVMARAHDKGFLTKHNAARLYWAYTNRGEDDAANEILKELRPRAAPRTPADAAFAGFIKDKAVAIVGPSSSGYNHNEEIERDFEIIIRMNYSGLEKLPEAQRSLAPQISYYNGARSDMFASDAGEDMKYLSELDFAVLHRRNYNKTSKAAGKYTKVRQADKAQWLFFPGSPNMLQIILQDLLSFEPARVKAFYVNLNLTDTLHDKEYLASLKRTDLEPRDQWRSLAKHNQMMQYNYVRALYARSLIEADDRLSEVLDLGTSEYMRQLEELENDKGTGTLSPNRGKT